MDKGEEWCPGPTWGSIGLVWVLSDKSVVVAVVIVVVLLLTVNCLTDRCAVVTYVNDESARTAVDATTTDAIRLHDRSQLCLSVRPSVRPFVCFSFCLSC